MTDKRFIIIGDDNIEFIMQNQLLLPIYDDKERLSLKTCCDLLNELHEENEHLKNMVHDMKKENGYLKKELDDFEFKFTQNFVKSNKDELYLKDAHTKIDAKDGIMLITVFIPQINEFVKINYRISKQNVIREYLKGGIKE